MGRRPKEDKKGGGRKKERQVEDSVRVLPKKFRVDCGKASAVFNMSKFLSGMKTKCILYEKKWISPSEFEKLAGKGASHNWRRSIRYREQPLSIFLKEVSERRECVKDSDCHPRSAGGRKRQSSKKPSSPPCKKDTDSDSGISVTTASLPPCGSFGSSLSDGEGPFTESECLPDLVTAVQEAMASLVGEATHLNILLYILNRYRVDPQEVRSLNKKLKKSLEFLTRMDLIVKKGADGREESDVELDKEDTLAKDTPYLSLEPPLRKRGRPPKVIKSSRCIRSQRLSPALSSLCGGVKKLPQQEVIKRILLYVKKKKLYDPDHKYVVRCDEKMKAVVNKSVILLKDISSCLELHMTDV